MGVPHETMFEWTSEAIDTLKTKWAAGDTAGTIAMALGGISRSAVIGKAHRLKLERRATGLPTEPKTVRVPRAARPKPNKADVDPRIEASRAERERRKADQAREAAELKARSAAERLEAERAAEMTEPVRYLDLRPMHCRAIVGRDEEDGLALSCGRPKVEGKSWCSKHVKLYEAKAFGMLSDASIGLPARRKAAR